MNKIVLCGIQEQGKDIIKFLYQHGIEVTHIVTIREETAIKNRSESTWVSYEDISVEYNIPIYYAKSYSLTHEEDVNYFTKNDFFILLLGGWQRLIKKQILKTITYPIGQHGSSEHLPEYRGRSPLNWSIIRGKKRLIWNLFLLDEDIDNGDVVDYCQFEINEFDDCNSMYYKVGVSVKHMLTRTIPKLINGDFQKLKQIGEPSYYEKRTPEDGKINFDDSVYDICNLIRGVTKPYPGSFVKYGKDRIIIWQAKLWDTTLPFYRTKKYGEIVEIFDNDFVVKCKDGLLLVTNHEDVSIFIGKRYV
tara:strand:+ start:5634 stop:6548 length:915 start_codon:yes stop_codon:yes gene_type:complete